MRDCHRLLCLVQLDAQTRDQRWGLQGKRKGMPPVARAPPQRDPSQTLRKINTDAEFLPLRILRG
eukprot:4000666-Lingulodinium_polyedra.AAC.1